MFTNNRFEEMKLIQPVHNKTEHDLPLEQQEQEELVNLDERNYSKPSQKEQKRSKSQTELIANVKITDFIKGLYQEGYTDLMKKKMHLKEK